MKFSSIEIATAILSIFLITSSDAEKSEQMQSLCAKATSVETAGQLLKCFNITKEDEKLWQTCFDEAGVPAGSCSEKYFKTCESEDLSGKFEKCAEERFKPLTPDERNGLFACIDKI